jgi:hypothetical protein
MNFLLRTSKSFRQLLIENYKAACFYAEDALDHIEDLPCTVSQIEFDASGKKHDCNFPFFVHLSGERVFTCIHYTLYVYSVKEFYFPIASYPLGDFCYSTQIFENCLYLVQEKIEFVKVFEVPTSLTEPLTFVTEIQTKAKVFNIFRNGYELLLSESDGWLQVFDIASATISHTWQIKETYVIKAIVAIDKTQYLIASLEGLFKSTKEKMIEHYYQGKHV